MEMRSRLTPRISLWLPLEAAVIAVVFTLCAVVDAATDPNDAQALQVLYVSLNSPSQLNGWKSSGGDPCTESWTGVTCQGSSVVSLQVSGLGLGGTLGYMLHNLASLKILDLSNNYIHDSIPYQLPPNLMILNLAGNNLNGGLPYSISAMASLGYLNISRNMLSQPIGNLFANLPELATLDLSFNNLTGDLPPSFSSLTNLSTLLLQSNQLSGSLDILVGLSLTNLNTADNKFSNSIPRELLSVPNFIYDSGTFSNGSAPPAPHNGPARHSHPHNSLPEIPTSIPINYHLKNKKKLTAWALASIVLGSLFAVLATFLALAFANRRRNRKEIHAHSSTENPPDNCRDKGMQEHRPKATTIVSDATSLYSEDMAADSLKERSGSMRRVKSPISVIPYTVATLQTATNCFIQDNLIGEGSLGRVYKGVFSNGKVMAIKKIDNAAASLQDEDIFHEAISNMSRLRHPNIVPLMGYCAEHGQRLLVHEFIANGSLHDMLHSADERSQVLTWNARMKIALGIARALEYLHEVCLPSVVHRNFKSANILLDEELDPHLSDCGLAVLAPNAERKVSSTQLIGSFGYSAPEFALSGIYTVKSDVYSFGVVTLELLTGRKPLDSSRVRSEQSLVRWATPQLHDIDALSKMIDPSLNGMYPAKSLSRFADTIALCVQPEPKFRPTMSEVVQSLGRLMQRATTTTKLRGGCEESSFAVRAQDHEPRDVFHWEAA